MKYLIVLISLLPVLVRADTVYSENLTVTGNTCIGFDCANDQAFSVAPLELKENNLRIRLQDTGAPTETVTVLGDDYYLSSDQMGGSWNLNANESGNGGIDYFGIEQATDNVIPRLSDGTAINYTCYYTGTTTPISGEANTDIMDVSVDGTIPQGEPWETEYCENVSEPLVRNGLRFTPGAIDSSGGVALGFSADTREATVSVGNASKLRRLAHLAEALDGADVLTVARMDAYVDQHALLDDLNATLDRVERRLEVLENPSNNGGSLPAALLAALGLLLATRRRQLDQIPSCSSGMPR